MKARRIAHYEQGGGTIDVYQLDPPFEGHRTIAVKATRIEWTYVYPCDEDGMIKGKRSLAGDEVACLPPEQMLLRLGYYVEE